MSGYRACACRDCFEIAIGEVDALCHECAKASCEANADTECAVERCGCGVLLADPIDAHIDCEAADEYRANESEP